MSDRGPIIHWPPELTVEDLLAEAPQLIDENNATLMWRTASRLSMAARGVVQGVRVEVCRPAVVAFANGLVASGALPMNDAAFVFYCSAVGVDGVDVVPLRKQLDSEDPFRKYNAVLSLAWKTPPDEAAIPILNEVLRENPDAVHFAGARARYDDQRDPIA